VNTKTKSRNNEKYLATENNIHNARHQSRALCAWSVTNISHSFAIVLQSWDHSHA